MPDQDISVESIIERVRSTYASCSSYQDSGEVVTVISSGPSESDRRTTKKRFTTSFERAGAFRFEFREVGLGPESEWPRCVVWSDGVFFRSWWTLRRGVESFESLDRALAGPTGVSGGSARAIPSLLRKDLVWIPQLPDAASTRIDGRESLDGRDCYVLQASRRAHGPERFWVDVELFLILRMEEFGEYNQASHQRMVDSAHNDPRSTPDQKKTMLEQIGKYAGHDFRSTTTKHYRPCIDVEIDSANWKTEFDL